MRRTRGFFLAAVEGGIPLVRIMRIRIYIYVDQDQGQDEMIKRKRTRTRTRMSNYYIVPHQVATPARPLTSWTKKTARARYNILIKDFLFHKRITRRDGNLMTRTMATIGWYILSTIQVLTARFCVFVVYSFVWKGACLFVFYILSSFLCVARCPPVGLPANLTATVQTSVSAVSTDAPTLAEKVTMQLISFLRPMQLFFCVTMQLWFDVARHPPFLPEYTAQKPQPRTTATTAGYSYDEPKVSNTILDESVFDDEIYIYPYYA